MAVQLAWANIVSPRCVGPVSQMPAGQAMLAAATTTRQLMSEAAPSITADPKALVSFSYISTASHPPSEDELERLLAASRSWNAQHDITGILMHNDGSFMQLLKGPREARVPAVGAANPPGAAASRAHRAFRVALAHAGICALVDGLPPCEGNQAARRSSPP